MENWREHSVIMLRATKTGDRPSCRVDDGLEAVKHYRSPAATGPGQRPATDTQIPGQIVECCVTDVGLRSNPRQIAGHAPAC